MTTVAKEILVPFKKTHPANKETHICVHNSIDLVRSTKSWMYFTGSPYKEKHKKRFYEYIVIFMQGQVSQNCLCTLIILSSLTVYTEQK